MNTSLMIAVERIVRPIVASRDRKQRMREELYAHIDSIYKEEFEKSGDELAACAAATARLGDPEVVRVELQASIPVWKQHLVRWDQTFFRKPKEARLRCALRVSVQLGAFIAAMHLGAVALVYVIAQKVILLEIIPFFVILSVAFGWNTFVVIMCAQPFLEPDGVLKKRKGLLLVGLLFGISAAVSHFLLWVVSSGWQDSIAILLPWAPLFAFIAGWGLFVLVVSLVRIEKRQTIPWETLELAD